MWCRDQTPGLPWLWCWSSQMEWRMSWTWWLVYNPLTVYRLQTGSQSSYGLWLHFSSPWGTLTLTSLTGENSKGKKTMLVWLIFPVTPSCVELFVDRIDDRWFTDKRVENVLSVSSASIRWHYNIFYVLHLMENAPPPLSHGDGRYRAIFLLF